MFRSRMQAGVALLVAALFLWTTSLVHAAEDASIARNDDMSAEAMVVDGLLLRPGGAIATLVGSVVFVVTLPFSIPTKSVDKAAQKLVVDPAKYTFARPLGQVEFGKPAR